MEKQRIIAEYLESGSLNWIRDWLNSGHYVSDSLFSLIKCELQSKGIKAEKPLTWRQKLYLSASETDKSILREKFQTKDKNTETVENLRAKLDHSSIEERVLMLQEIYQKLDENGEIEKQIQYFEKNKEFLKEIAEVLPANLPKENIQQRIKALKRTLEPKRIEKQGTSIETQSKNRAELLVLEQELKKMQNNAI
jgi:hypothetical protein